VGHSLFNAPTLQAPVLSSRVSKFDYFVDVFEFIFFYES